MAFGCASLKGGGSHALYKEIIYTLNDYVTVKSWADWRALKLAEELKCGPALKLAIELNEGNLLTAPPKALKLIADA